MLQSPFFSSDGTSTQPEKKYHYAFFLPAADYSFFRNLKDGAISAAETMDCSITFHAIDSNPESLKMAQFSGVDGIAIYPYEKNDEMIGNLMEIEAEGIPIVQIENEIMRNESTFLIGTNNFESGMAIGKLAMKTGKESLNIALIYSEKNPGLMSEENLLEMGLLSVLGGRIGNLHTEKTSLNPLDAERLTYELIRQSHEFDLIVLTDPNDTLVTVQAIIDMNLVGVVDIIGFGNYESIMNYINKGLVLGTIVRNPYRIGFSAVMALQEICSNGYTSAYVDTGITIISEGEQDQNPDE